MPCPTCVETKPVPKCVTSLVVGAIDAELTDVYVYIKNLTTGRIQRVDVTSDINGQVSFLLADPDVEFYSENFVYELWVTLRTTDPNTRLDVTIGYATNDCFTVRFTEYFDDLDLAIFSEVDLEIDT